MTLLRHVLGQALLHFLWQGALLLLLWGLARRALRHAAPAVRYRLDLAVLALIAALPAITAAIFYALFDPVAFVPAPRGPETIASVAAVADVARGAGRLWLIGLAIGVLTLGAAWLYLRWLIAGGRPVRLTPDLDAIVGAVPGLRVLESGLVSSPAVAGGRAPVLLLPAGIATRLPAPELRALLLHELAHLRRRDFGINLLQRLAEIVWWYHPAVWVISHAARRERELCCDAEAAVACGRPLALARGLVRLEEWRAASPTLAIGAGTGDLSERVRRLLHPGVRPVSRAVRLVLPPLLACGAVSAIACGTVAVGRGLAASLPIVRIQGVDPAGRFTFEMVAGRARAAAFDGQPIPHARIQQRGDRVDVLDPAGRSTLHLQLIGGHAIRWSPRAKSP